MPFFYFCTMAYKSLKDCVKDLENNGMLIRIKDEVDPYLEMSAIHQLVFKHHKKAILFENGFFKLLTTRIILVASWFSVITSVVTTSVIRLSVSWRTFYITFWFR